MTFFDIIIGRIFGSLGTLMWTCLGQYVSKGAPHLLHTPNKAASVSITSGRLHANMTNHALFTVQLCPTTLGPYQAGNVCGDGNK